MENHEQDWVNFWKDICTNPDGSINLDQIKRELADYRFMLHEVPKVYVAVTNGQLSKPNYFANDVIVKYEDYINEFVDEQKQEVLKEIDKEIENYKDADASDPESNAIKYGLNRAKEIINEVI